MCTAKWGAGRADGRARFGSWDAPTRGTPRCLATFSEVARLRGVPESVRPKIWTVRDRPRGPHAVWRWERDEVEQLPIKEGGE
jgi:hypothetical protein